ncbi:G-protein coupled receptor moody [Holothuria leucospilota]|uniref:G-protein coupled receptor moody n=1 Tax=Holothuria leucospilota TaxID=206669 RepID=A0A9Q1BEI7_HOLLE|nr:G-protein coupled receptor moody [Holothuria leucospilota]
MAYKFDDYPAQQIIVAILACIAAITGLFGNVLVLVAIGLSRKLHTSTNAFVTSLAACNLLTCSTMPYHVNTILSDPPKNLGVCRFFGSVLISTQIISLITLSLIAVLRAFQMRVHRWIGISTFDRVYTKRNIGVMIAFSWIVPFLAVFVSSVARWATLGYNEKYNICIIEASKSGMASLVAGIVVGLPSLVIIVACYSLIFFHMHNYHAELKLKLVSANPTDNNASHQHSTTPDDNKPTPKRKVKNNQSSAEQSISEREHKINRTLFIVVCAFLISVLPFSIAIISPNINAAIPWCAVLLMSNSAMNPIIYGLHHPEFHKVFQNYFTCKICRGVRMIPSTFGTLTSNVNSSPGANTMQETDTTSCA